MISFVDLRPGDRVRHVNDKTGQALVVTANYGDRVTAVRTADLTNPSEWRKVNGDETHYGAMMRAKLAAREASS